MGAEDRDFAARWVAAGWRIFYAPDIVVSHAQVLTFCVPVLAGGRRIHYDRLISTIPLPALVRLLAGAVSPQIRQWAWDLKYNAVHTVNIGLADPHCPTGRTPG